MREIARVAQGFYPTQDRIVRAIAQLIGPPQNGIANVLDAGCGEGKALHDLRELWLAREPHIDIRLHGIESDQGRCRKADALFKQGKGGGSSLWCNIEDANVDHPPGLLYFNPPYDRIRGAGRLELVLYQKVCKWVQRGTVMVLIVPDYILADASTGLAWNVEKEFRVDGLFRYPEPEYSIFKQCVLIGTRRDRAISKSKADFPKWAENPAGWQVLPLDLEAPVLRFPATEHVTHCRRLTVSPAVMLDCLSKSPLRSSLLREALSPPPRVEPPLLPLRNGHLALALAGGLCDGQIKDDDGNPFLIKGTTDSKVLKVKSFSKMDADGCKVADVDVHRTVYTLKVRCLRDDGTIENYSSADDKEAAAVVHAEPTDHEEVIE